MLISIVSFLYPDGENEKGAKMQEADVKTVRRFMRTPVQSLLMANS